MDFRDEAVDASRRILGESSDSIPPHTVDSLCLPAPGGAKFLRTYDMLQTAAIAGLLLCMTLCLLLTLVDFVLGAFFGSAAFLALLFIRKFFCAGLAFHLSRRPKSLCPHFGQKAIPVTIEDTRTVERVKLFVEDQAICVLDHEQRRLLIEGCAYRYLICANDVVSVKNLFGFALCGVEVRFRVGEAELGLALCLAGHGAVASMIESFAPRVGSRGMFKQIWEALALQPDQVQTGERHA